MKRILLLIIACLILAFIWSQSVIPENRSDRESKWFTSTIVNPLLNKYGYSSVRSNIVRKAAHVSEYFLLCFVAVFMWKGNIVKGFYTGFTAAFLDESVQLLVNRGSLISDIWIDLIGVALGSLLGWLIYKAAEGIGNQISKSKTKRNQQS